MNEPAIYSAADAPEGHRSFTFVLGPIVAFPNGSYRRSSEYVCECGSRFTLRTSLALHHELAAAGAGAGAILELAAAPIEDA